ncbi:hypothetical protein [Anaerotruncus rubiinfantis]|uniref:hypothetical protein n=1 Tax=Anaerotruncus rubiinfantis TaxID=1720200 RepID=UPI0011CB522F|nr:hypothetical protein [Anaerotruncus rubiinfantis]
MSKKEFAEALHEAGGCYCQECTKFRRYTKNNITFGICKRHNSEVRENDFCSYNDGKDGGNVEEFAALKKAHDDGRLVELPIIAMVEQTLENGKFKNSAKAQAFNGRYAVVYIDKSKWSTPLIDICGSTPYRIDEAVDRLAALKEKEAGTDVHQQDD